MTEPTKLVTAAEWQKHLFPFETGDDDIVYANGLELEPVIRDIQRNAERHTLERAAKATCTWCRDGYAVTGDRCPRTHVYGTDGHVPCYAAEIWALIPETSAPTAGNEETETKEVNA